MSFHARLSASSAERWMACPGSVTPSEGRNTTSFAAEEGTFAHELAAAVLDGLCEPDECLGSLGNAEGFDIICDEEMIDAIQTYVALCKDLPNGTPEIPLLEPLQKVDPDFGGTADYVQHDEVKKKLTVVDFKYGKGVYVKAPDNVQLKIYALGALLYIKRPVEDVEVVIVQPRFKGSKPVRSDTFKAVELLEFAADIKEAARKTRLPGAFRHAGKHCQFCPIEQECCLSMKFTRSKPVTANDFDIYQEP